jgi:hypothetical protein
MEDILVQICSIWVIERTGDLEGCMGDIADMKLALRWP